MSRPFPSTCIEALSRGEEPAFKAFSQSLISNGFAIVSLGQGSEAATLRQALIQCSAMGQFRFPPVDEEARYEKNHKDCFKILFKATRQCLGALLNGHRSFESSSNSLQGALAESFSGDYELFGSTGEANYPFDDSSQAFGTSFFNIFHYDHGLLNSHRDRCLVTAIFVHQDSTVTQPKSALWVQGATGEWVNTDRLVQNDELIILLGEEFQALAKSAGLELWAAEHCIRVDPKGPYIEHSHHRPDPDTPVCGNRMSAALVLSH